MTIYKLYIDGQWRTGSDGEDIPLINPATEREIAKVAKTSKSDIEASIASASGAVALWRNTPAAERGKLLVAASKILNGKVEDAAAALSAEQGKTLDEARGEYARAVETLAWNGENAVRLSAPIPVDANRAMAPEPIGIVAAFTPWNYPAVLNARKLAAPLAAGCPVILKGAEETPSAAVFIVEALVEAGIPKGVVNLLFGNPPEISEGLLGSRAVKVMTFTGSTPIGKQLAALAAANLQRCVLELGGHSPVVVFADADIDKAIEAITEYKFECAGQSCNAPSRVLVERPVYERVVAGLVAKAGQIRIGVGTDAQTQMGPMANARRIDAMKKLTDDAVALGAKVETGGARLDREGFFWPPTILTEVPVDAKVLREEPFGPILTIAPFDTIEEAIAESNATDYGLASYFFSGSEDVQRRMIAELAAGSVSVNRMKGVSCDAPNAGINESGYGYEGGDEGLRTFQNLKLVNGAGAIR